MKKEDSIQISKQTIELVEQLKSIGLLASKNTPELISVYFENTDTEAIIKWDNIMYPFLKKPIKDLDIPTLARDGVCIQRTWNWVE